MSVPKSDKGEDSDDEHVNKENATPPTSPHSTTKQETPEVRIKVGGVTFLLDQDTLQKLNSEYLNRRVAFKDAEVAGSSIQEQTLRKQNSQDESAITSVVIDADAECFSSLVHMARFGTLPTSIFQKAKRELLLEQAEVVWGIRSQVESALEKARSDFRQSCNCTDVIYHRLMRSPMATTTPVDAKTSSSPALAPPPAAYASANANTNANPRFYAAVPAGEQAVCLSGPHHNYRRDDGSRRVFCSSCGHRDIDWRYHVGDYYSSCQKCQKEIRYKPQLGWCHKCRQCDECQTSECPGVPIKQLEDQVIPFMIETLKTEESSLTFF